MKSKIFALILMTAFLVSFAGAVSVSVSNDLTDNKNSTTVTLTSSGTLNETLSYGVLSNIVDGSETVVLTHSAFPTFLDVAESKTFSVNVTSISSGFDLGKHTTTLTVTSTDANGTVTSAGIPITYVKEFCEEGNIQSARVKITNIKDVLSDTEWKWRPRDSLEIDVKVKNSLDDDEDFVVEFGIYDTEDKTFIEIDGDDTLSQDISINEGDTETVTFTFEAPVDLQDSSGRYDLYVKAYVDGGEDEFCSSGRAVDLDSSVDNLRITRDRNDVILDKITAPETVSPGETVKISAEAVNVGRDDETKVKAVLRNSALAVDQESTSFRLDKDDSQRVNFEFIVPQNIKSGTYELELHTLFDYDKNNDEYDKESEDTWTINLKVVGGTTEDQNVPTASITASLDSEAKAGQELIITSTVRNTGSQTATYAIDVRGYDSWATLNSVSDRVLTLPAGNSKTITLNFAVLDSASGEESFTIEANSAGKLVTKEVAVNIAAAPAGGFNFGSISFGGNGIIWVIAAVNLILIILIIAVAIRISRR